MATKMKTTNKQKKKKKKTVQKTMAKKTSAKKTTAKKTSTKKTSAKKTKAKKKTTTKKASTLQRPQNPMPAFVRQALVEENLLAAYERRPPYQQNDWLGWIARAKQEATKARRLASMLKELRQGHGYMGMVWNPA